MFVFLTTVPISIIGFILIESSVDTLKILTWELQQERINHASQEITSLIANLTSEVNMLLATQDIEQMDLIQRQELLSFVLQKKKEINIIGFYDSLGNPLNNLLAFDSKLIKPSELADHRRQVASTRKKTPRNAYIAFSQPYNIQRPGQADLSVEPRNETVAIVTMKLSSSDAAFLGMEVSLYPLQKLIERNHTSRQGEIILLSRKGELLLRKSNQEEDEQQTQKFMDQVFSPIRSEIQYIPQISGVHPITTAGGADWLAAYASLEQPPWVLVSIEPISKAYHAARKMTWQVITVVLISLSIAMAIGILFAFGITRPIAKCVTGALAVARGRFGYTINIKTRNEIGELAHTFNYMSNQLLYYDKENKDLVSTLEKGYLETIRALANSIDAKDPYTRGHSMRVTNLALAVGRKMGLDQEEMRILRYGGILHDIGKIGISEMILAKREKLTTDERDLIKTHPVLGEKIIAPIDFLQIVRPIVRHHHEWNDGSGYPDGLRGTEIPLGAKIVNATDTFDAVTSDRPYQKAVSSNDAIKILDRLRGSQIDPAVCDTLISVIRRKIEEGEFGDEWQTDYTDPTGMSRL
jgi:putative nucleotidyltransferase with HDIG domain